MKKLNKKGFTIVEMVIVIAVIAILAAVMIPTFSGVVANAEKAAAKSNAKAEYQRYTLEYADASVLADDFIYQYNDYYVMIKDGDVGEEVYTTKDAAVLAFGSYTAENGDVIAQYEVSDVEAEKKIRGFRG